MDGVRALSTLAVIFGHEFFLRVFSSSNLVHIIGDFTKSNTFVSLCSFIYSVDTFFFLSGFFVAFSVI